MGVNPYDNPEVKRPMPMGVIANRRFGPVYFAVVFRDRKRSSAIKSSR
jgi:hypothetical protein